ncbi:MAG: histidinol phosphatase [Bacilli bacterium]|nr:histidinol phosphatase [Bacilli bacterium]
MLEKWDGHTHTSFCKHGSNAELDLYLDRAIDLGFRRYSITEHPPLPAAWVANPELMLELAMNEEELTHYMVYATNYKTKYEERIRIHVGLELDYLDHHEAFTLSMVDQWHDTLEDIVMSVHYLPGKNGMRCIDYTAVDFLEGLLAYYGSIDQVVDEYYNHVPRAID